MLKSLLIHNDNTPLDGDIRITKSILFSPTVKELSDSDIDTFISKKILPQLSDDTFEIIYIRDTLSETYIDFYGLIMAYHIRLSIKDIDKISLLPIVILSDIKSYTINKLTSLGRILFTKNIFLAPNNNTVFEKFNNATLDLKKLTLLEYQNEFLNKIHIEAPKDYLSHHSITNEWAIYQWSQLLGVHTKATKTNEEKINTMLYFKYLVNKYNLEEKSEKSNKENNKSGKILLIDDKGIDGWNDVISKFIDSNYTNVEFFTLENKLEKSIFKDRDLEALKLSVQNKIETINPDVILLDLRLLEHFDSKQEKVLDISGIKILKHIKKLNPSIQIIIFSASTDSLILDELYANGILGYIKKDSPTNKYLASKNSLTKLDKLIKKGLDRKYLKTIWETQEIILQMPFLTNNTNSIIFELRKNITFVFEILNSNIPNAFIFSMLSIFKCIELLSDYFIEEIYDNGKKYSYWKSTNTKIKTLDYGILKEVQVGDYNLSTENKIRAIIDMQTNLDDNDFDELIKKIVCSRNYVTHPQEKPTCEGFLIQEPKQEHIVEWLKMLETILNNIK